MKSEISIALQGKTSQGAVSLWGREYHCWSTFSEQNLIVGNEFGMFTKQRQEYALATNAKNFADVFRQSGFSAFTIPSRYWEISAGKDAYYRLGEKVGYEPVRKFRELVTIKTVLIGKVDSRWIQGKLY